jgi:alkylmercury lyase-like protein
MSWTFPGVLADISAPRRGRQKVGKAAFGHRACCAMDALGIAPMVGHPVEIRSRCHHCHVPLEFSAETEGPGSEAEGIMLWFGKRSEDRCRVADTY